MYLNIMGRSTDEELVKYSSLHLTSMHEWDPSVLDYSRPEGNEEPGWSCDAQHIDLIDSTLTPMGSIPGEPSPHCHPWLI